jgi:hypothetical protein
MARLTRRRFLYLSSLSAGAGLLAACGNTSQPTPTPAPELAATATALTRPTDALLPTSAPTVAPAAPSAAAPAPTSTAAPSAAFTSDMAHAVARFLDTLDGNQRKKATYAFDNAERFRWHWTTPGGFPRNGLPLREMNAPQKAAAHAMLKASISESGYQKALDIMSLQKDLGNDTELYFVTVFGTPGDKAPWGWRFEGHHLSRQFTVAGGQVAMTPLFHGSWPTSGGAGLRAMPREEDAALELINALQGKNRQTAIFQQNTLLNHVTQNDPKVGPLPPVGVLLSDLDDRQQKLVQEIMQSYLGAMPSFLSASAIERISKAGLDKIRFGWAGSLEKRKPQYYRIQGLTFLLEFDNSRNGGTHVHSVWRDYERDFGYHLL